MADLRVTCATKAFPGTSDQHIIWLGGPGWGKTQIEVLRDIKYGVNSYYTLVNGRRAELEVVRDYSGREWVQTRPDYFAANNLYQLPPCTG